MKLPAVDYHIHTVYSGHSSPEMLVRPIVEKAEQIGLESIALTEHCFYSLMGPATMEAIQRDVAAVETRIEVLIGMEIDPDYTREGHLVFEDFNPGDLRPVLVSTHAYSGLGKGWHEKLSFTGAEKEKIYRDWFRIMEKTVTNPLVNGMAHPGRLLSRNGVVEEFSGEVLRDFERLFEAAAKNNVAIEINDNVLHRFETERLRKSYLDVLRLGMEKGLKFSIGSDAHQIEDIGNRSRILAAAQSLGLHPSHFYRPKG
ncbi:MAG: PHP domain-containing protein [Verrucomicrobiae bacterium]|nr:PHP domain-containing protein [Verrucomicrobiae bacterium]